jgi:hypothetical protein
MDFRPIRIGNGRVAVSVMDNDIIQPIRVYIGGLRNVCPVRLGPCRRGQVGAGKLQSGRRMDNLIVRNIGQPIAIEVPDY